MTSDYKDQPSGKGITLIVPALEMASTPVTDRAGGQTHGLGSYIKRLTSKTISQDVLHENMQRCMEQLRELLQQARDKTLEGWTLEEVSVSLAISAEGTVGIATAGAETSIEATFKRSP